MQNTPIYNQIFVCSVKTTCLTLGPGLHSVILILNSVKSCILISNFNINIRNVVCCQIKKITWTEIADNTSRWQNIKNMKVMVFIWSADSSPFWLTSLVKEIKIEKIYEILLNILKFKFIDLSFSMPAINEIKNTWES